MTRYILFLLAFLFLLVPMQAKASDPAQIGVVIEVEGTATLTRAADKSKVALTPDEETPVFLKDIIETDAESKVHLLFIDNTEITIGENASLAVDDYIFDPDNGSRNKGRFSVLRGVFLFTSGLLTKNDNPDVEIEIAYGSLGIRGTVLWGGQLEGDEEYGVLVQEGSVMVQTDRGRVRVNEGMGTNIRNRKAIPSRASTWSTERIKRSQNAIALKRQEIIKERIAARRKKHGDLRENLKEKIEERREIRQERREENKGNYRLKKDNSDNGDKQGKVMPSPRQSTGDANADEIRRLKREKMEAAMKERMRKRAEELKEAQPAKREEIIEKMHLEQKDVKTSPSADGFE